MQSYHLPTHSYLEAHLKTTLNPRMKGGADDIVNLTTVFFVKGRRCIIQPATSGQTPAQAEFLQNKTVLEIPETATQERLVQTKWHPEINVSSRYIHLALLNTTDNFVAGKDEKQHKYMGKDYKWQVYIKFNMWFHNRSDKYTVPYGNSNSAVIWWFWKWTKNRYWNKSISGWENHWSGTEE